MAPVLFSFAIIQDLGLSISYLMEWGKGSSSLIEFLSATVEFTQSYLNYSSNNQVIVGGLPGNLSKDTERTGGKEVREGKNDYLYLFSSQFIQFS